MKSTVGNVTRFNRWLSQSSDRAKDQDPWNDFRLDSGGETKMAFEDDFHLTVIPNFHHDSDAYISKLENKLERLQQVNKNPNTKEMVAAITRARALRMKYAEMNPDANAKPQDESAEDEDGGILALFPTLIMPISRRLFPRLALTKEEAQNLVKYDFLLLRHEGNAAGSAEVDGYEVKDANTAPDTSWEQQQKDSSIENPFVVFETPEANEFQIPKNWVNDHHSTVINEVHHSTANTPDDTANAARGATNRSALSLSANINAIQEASTITSFTPARRSEDAFYHFAYIRTSMTSTQESAKAETPSDCNGRLGTAEYIRWNSTSVTTPCGPNPFASACSVDVPSKQHTSFVAECNALAESKGLSKSSVNITEGRAKDQIVLVTQSTPSLNAVKDTEGNDSPMATEDNKQPHAVEDDKRPQAIDEYNSRSQRSILGVASCNGTDEDTSERMHENGLASMKDVQDTVFPEVTVASSTTKESVERTQSGLEEGLRQVSVEKGHRGHVSEPTVREVTVASSSTHDSLSAGIEVPWLFDKESDMTLGGEDVLHHMSSLVRASVDEDDDPARADGIQASQMSAVYTQMSSTCGCSDRTQTKASEGTSGNITTNYSDPHSNLFDEESLIRREEGQAPIIRMYGPFPHDIHMSLQGSLLSWGLPRGAERLHNLREVASPKLVSLPAVNSDAAGHSDDSLPLATKEGDSGESPATSRQRAAKIVSRLHSDSSSRPSFRTRISKDAKCRKAPSTKSQCSKDRSSASSASTQSTIGPRNDDRPMRLSSSKLSTSSMFKNRQRSVHWFKTIEDVDSDTVVKDCDYLVTSQLKTKVPIETNIKAVAPKAMSRTSKEPSESDANDGSIVDEGCKKFAKRVLEEAVIVAGKVNSFLEFYEASCSKEEGALRDPEETTASIKHIDASTYEGAGPVESLEGCNESAGDLVTAKDSTGAKSDKQKAVVNILESPEPLEAQSKTTIFSKAMQHSRTATEGERTNASANADTESLEVLSMTASSLNVDNEDPHTTVECGGKNVDSTNGSPLLKSLSTEALQCKPASSLLKSREQLENIANSHRTSGTDEVAELSRMVAEARSKPMSCDKSADVLESRGEQRATTPTSERESVSNKAASHDAPTSSECVDTQATLPREQVDRRDDDKQEQTNVPTGSEKPLPECETKAAEGAAKQGSCSVPSRHARGSWTQSSSDDKQSAAPEDSKKKTAEGRDKEDEDSSANRHSTVLQCHELAGSSRFSTFAAPNKGAALTQRSFNMTRTLRITTTNQFKPLNLRHSITGILGSDSDLLGRPLSVQSREVVPPRTPKRPVKGKKPTTHPRESDCAFGSLSKKSGSCENTSRSNNMETPASEVTARRSHSAGEAHVRANLGGSGVRSKTQTIGRHSGTALGDNVTKTYANEMPLVTGENEGSVRRKTKSEKWSESQLPLKKRACCRMPENWNGQKKYPDEGSLPAEHKTKNPGAVVREANVNNAEGEGTESSLAFQDVPTTQAAFKSNVLQESEDMDFAHVEYSSDSAPEERTISLVPESQYSTIGAEINHVPPISVILGGDANMEGVKLCLSLPSEGECTAASTISKDDQLPNEMTASAMAPDETSIMEGDKSASISFEHSTMPSCKPVLAKGCRNKGGEKDVNAEVDNSETSSTCVTLDADAVEESTSSIHCDVEDDLADNYQPGSAYEL